jgi:hypothetical protein
MDIRGVMMISYRKFARKKNKKSNTLIIYGGWFLLWIFPRFIREIDRKIVE